LSESKSTSSSKGASTSQPKSLVKSAYAEEHGQKVDDLEEHSHQVFNTGDDDVIPIQETLEDTSKRNPPCSLNPDREWHKTKTVDKRPSQPWISQLAQATGTQYLFNEFLATPIDFSVFIMNGLKIDKLTQEVLTGLTYDLIKGTCKSVVKLEYHLEEVIKATNDRLDWHNPEGKPYPHDLNKPLPNRLMCTDELHKFSDGTLNHVRTALSDIATGIEMDYLPKRRLSKQDKQRAHVMINAIDKKLMVRRLMRNLEKFVGERPYGEDLRLLEMTI
nr:hypothetical protein [Tanacetum cinerariifolium]